MVTTLEEEVCDLCVTPWPLRGRLTTALGNHGSFCVYGCTYSGHFRCIEPYTCDCIYHVAQFSSSVPVTTRVRISFRAVVEYHSIVRIHHISLFSHSSVAGHLVSFQIVAVMDTAAGNIRSGSVWTMSSFLLRRYLAVKLLGNMESLCFTSEKLSDCFSKRLHLCNVSTHNLNNLDEPVSRDPEIRSS